LFETLSQPLRLQTSCQGFKPVVEALTIRSGDYRTVFSSTEPGVIRCAVKLCKSVATHTTRDNNRCIERRICRQLGPTVDITDDGWSQSRQTTTGRGTRNIPCVINVNQETSRVSFRRHEDVAWSLGLLARSALRTALQRYVFTLARKPYYILYFILA